MTLESRSEALQNRLLEPARQERQNARYMLFRLPCFSNPFPANADCFVAVPQGLRKKQKGTTDKPENRPASAPFRKVAFCGLLHRAIAIHPIPFKLEAAIYKAPLRDLGRGPAAKLPHFLLSPLSA